MQNARGKDEMLAVTCRLTRRNPSSLYWHIPCDIRGMKTHLLSALALSLALVFTSMPPALADAVQKDTPGAQGTEGTDPTHQDSDVTGPNGEHSSNTNPANSPAPAHHKKHHKKTCNTSCSTDSASGK
jgi:hypothetical protein